MASETWICKLLSVSVLLPLISAYNYNTNPEVCNHRGIVHRFTDIDYVWPNATARHLALDSKRYIPSNNVISGLNIYKDDIYVTVPRWRLGVPSTLNKIVTDQNGKSILEPFPSWEMQKIGDCNALQFVQSIEIDPNRGWMWIIDTGRINFFSVDGTAAQNLCPAKLVIFDLNSMSEITRHVFPDEVANRTRTFLNDIVVQYRKGRPRYAYITDDLTARLIVYDRRKNKSHFYSHPSSMLPEPGKGNITIGGETLEISDGINGIALSSDMNFLYYGQLSGLSIYQIPTSVVRKPNGNFAANVRRVGSKPSQASGMVYSKNHNLYFPALGENTIYRWDIKQDMENQHVWFNKVRMENITKFIPSDPCISFVDVLKLDQDCNLWFSVNRLHKFVLGTMDFSGASGSNVLIWKVLTDSTGYLDRRNSIDGIFSRNTRRYRYRRY